MDYSWYQAVFYRIQPRFYHLESLKVLWCKTDFLLYFLFTVDECVMSRVRGVYEMVRSTVGVFKRLNNVAFLHGLRTFLAFTVQMNRSYVTYTRSLSLHNLSDKEEDALFSPPPKKKKSLKVLRSC